MEETVRQDPVCKMERTDHQYSTSYRGIDFYFCSEQCLHKFSERPALYVGDPKHGLAPKQRHQIDKKCHRIKLKQSLDEEQAATLKNNVENLMGVMAVEVSGSEIRVTYDLLKIQFEDIEHALLESGAVLFPGLGEKLKSYLIHFSEECELDNLAHPPEHGRS